MVFKLFPGSPVVNAVGTDQQAQLLVNNSLSRGGPSSSTQVLRYLFFPHQHSPDVSHPSPTVLRLVAANVSTIATR